MTRQELHEHLYELTNIEKERKASSEVIPSRFYSYLDSLGMKDENGIYIFPDSHFKLPYSVTDTSIWSRLDTSSHQSMLTIKRASRFYREPLARARFIAMRYVYSGSPEIRTMDSSFTLTANDTCLLNSGFAFSQYLPHDDDLVFTLMFEKDYIIRNVLQDTKISGVLTSFILDYIMDNKNGQNYIIFHGKENEQIQNVVDDLLCEYIDPTPYGEALIESYIRIFLIHLLCCEYEYSKTPKSRQIIRLAEILDYINKNFNTVTLDSLSHEFGYNSKYLSRLIKNYTGKNFIDLITEKRMNWTCLLLENTDLPIRRIMEECGLSNETYFYQCFRSYFQMTPHQYRNQHRKESGTP